jgi:Domain of unknown function (DUF929)
MSKRPQGNASSSKAQQRSSQQRVNTPRPAQRQHNKRKVQQWAPRGLWLIIGVLLAIVAVIGLFVYLSTRSTGGTASSGSSSYPTTAADPTVVQQITTVDPSILATVGTGSGQVTPPTKISGSPALLTGSNGKPEVLYDGGEYCPYCAAERWAMIVALSRFGSFHNLSQESSSSTDVYPSTPTFSFYHSSYTSQYLDFVAVEEQSYAGVILQQPTASEEQLITTYDAGSSIPFVDIGNRYTITGASYSPQVLSGLDWQSIADALSNPQTQAAQAILGSANYLTADLCTITNQQPGSVCGAAPIPQIAQALRQTASNQRSTQSMILIAPIAVVRRTLLIHPAV